MPIVFNSLLSSAVANATFLDKTQDDTTIGKVTLANTDSESGSQVDNAQREINKSKKIIFGESTKVNGDTISLNDLSLDQEVRMIGDGAPVTLNVLPFTGVKVVEDGTTIILVGHDDTNTVTIPFNNVDYGCYLNGDATLLLGYTVTLVYNDEIKRYCEISRNF